MKTLLLLIAIIALVGCSETTSTTPTPEYFGCLIDDDPNYESFCLQADLPSDSADIESCTKPYNDGGYGGNLVSACPSNSITACSITANSSGETGTIHFYTKGIAEKIDCEIMDKEL